MPSFSLVQPFTATYTTVLSQDVVMTATIPVDSTSPAPVGPFTNPSAGGRAGAAAAEALVVSGGRLCHAARQWTSDGGWTLATPVSGAMAREVAAGTAYAGTAQAAVYGLYQDDSQLQVIQLNGDGVTWSGPSTVAAALHTNLRSAYSPAGKLGVYGQDVSGNLVIAHQPTVGGRFISQAYTLPNPLADGDHFLCLTDETSWTLAANVGGQLWIYTGVLDGSSSAPSSAGQAGNYSGTLQQIVLGYWSTNQQALMFVFVDSTGVLQVWASAGGNSVAAPPPPSPTGTVTAAAGHVYLDPESGVDSIHIYTLDDAQNLSVLHQDPTTPWNTDDTPSWAAYIPIDTAIAAMAVDCAPADVPTLFALDGGDFSLRLHQQDPSTQLWLTGAVLQTTASAFEVTRFRAEVNLVDARGNPLVRQPVQVVVAPGSSGVDLWAGGALYPITSSTGATLSTDATGKLTLAVLSTGLDAPALCPSTRRMAPARCRPSTRAARPWAPPR